jgi:phage gpG-like protein
MASKWGFESMLNRIEKVKKDLPVVLGNMAKNHFIDSFDKGGFTDESFSPWQKRKRAKRNTRALLVNTGKLKRSIRVKRASFAQIIISTSVKYAQIHNDGGAINKAHRLGIVHMGEHDVTGRNTFTNGKARGNKNILNHVARKVYIPKHTITMPKRQFIGDSIKLNRALLAEIEKTFNKIL